VRSIRRSLLLLSVVLVGAGTVSAQQSQPRFVRAASAPAPSLTLAAPFGGALTLPYELPDEVVQVCAALVAPAAAGPIQGTTTPFAPGSGPIGDVGTLDFLDGDGSASDLIRSVSLVNGGCLEVRLTQPPRWVRAAAGRSGWVITILPGARNSLRQPTVRPSATPRVTPVPGPAAPPRPRRIVTAIATPGTAPD
jgi:hypothetical protein